MVFEYLHNTGDPKSIHIHYCPGKRSPYQNIYNLLRVNKWISNFTATWLYGAHELVFEFPTNDLPLYIRQARQSTRGMIQQVRLRHKWGQNLTLGLRLLPCCTGLQSLKISTEDNIPKSHLNALKQMRLEKFEYDGPPMQEMEEIREIILGRTKPKGRLLKLSPEEIVSNSHRAANKANYVAAGLLSSKAIL